jgi:hypothetical protein
MDSESAPAKHTGRVVVDGSRGSLLLVTFEGTTSDAAFEDYLRRYGQALESGGKRVVIIDALAAAVPSASQRKRQADWQRQHHQLLVSQALGFAFIISSSLVRGGLTAILWLSPLPSPHHVASSREEAMAWAAEKLSVAGLRLP